MMLVRIPLVTGSRKIFILKFDKNKKIRLSSYIIAIEREREIQRQKGKIETDKLDYNYIDDKISLSPIFTLYRVLGKKYNLDNS